MSKKNVLWLTLSLIFLIVFNVVFFVIAGVDHGASVWISYVFIHIAYIVMWLAPLLIRKSDHTATLASPIYMISSVYFIIVFIASLIIMLIHPDKAKATVVIQIVLLGIYAAVLITYLIANEYTANNLEKSKANSEYVKESASKLQGIAHSIDDNQLKKQIEKLYDIVNSSPTKSKIEVRDYEVSVMDSIESLEENIASEDFETAKNTIAKIQKDANERNRRLKY